MLCPLRIRSNSNGWIAKNHEDFECLKECAWLVQEPMTNSFSCAMAQLASEGRGIPYVTLAEQFLGTESTS